MRRDAVILLDADGGPVVRRVRAFDRLRARLRARALDRALAAGKPSEAAPAVALRARRLTELSKRTELARTLSQLVNRARQAPASQVPLARRAVLSASGELSELATELVAPGPVGAGGVAQVQLLISDGTGPLYNPDSRIDLATAARHAIEALRLYRRQPAW